MKLGVISRIARDAISKYGDTPKWIDALLSPINNFIEQVGLALQGRLTFQDNFLCKIVVYDMIHDQEVEVNPTINKQLQLRVGGVIPLQSEGSIDSFKWVQKPNGNIGVTFKFGDLLDHKTKILILLE